MIVEERPNIKGRVRTCYNLAGYMDDYTILDNNGVGDWQPGQWLCLVFKVDKHFPTGGMHGKDYDIIEEIL